MKKFLILIILILLIVFAIIIYKKPSESIKIGVLAPLTGSTSEYGENTVNGIKLAINETKKIKGGDIELFIEDTKCDPKESLTAINKLLDINNVDIILGTACSGSVLAIAPVLNERKIPIISACASSPEITNAGDYIFRVYPSDDYDAGVAAKAIINDFEKKKVSVLYVNNDYGVALAKSFKSQFTGLEGEILNEESYMQDSKDFRTQLIKIKNSNPEVVYFISYPIDGGLAVKQAREIGIEAIFIGTSGLKANDFIAIGGQATEDFIVGFPSDNVSKKQEKFEENYISMFNIKPGICSDRGYDSVYLLKEVYSQDKEKIKNNLYNIKDFEGVIGNINFDENGDLINVDYNLLQIKNGEFVEYK